MSKGIELAGAGPLDGARLSVPDRTVAVVILHRDHDGHLQAHLCADREDTTGALDIVGVLHDLADQLHDTIEGTR